MAFSAFALSGAFVGCTDYTEFSQEEIKLAEFNKQYDDEFVKLFGTPDPNHDWGMNTLTPIQSLGGGLSTRATGFENGDGQVLVNKNQWIERDANPGTGYHNAAYRTSALAHDIQIPGWPHLNGLYYGSTGGGALQDALTPAQLDAKGNSWQPVGDVTEYEIQYVTAWFRTHQNPESVSLHLSDFFIQNISQDDDQDAYTSIDLDNISVTDLSTRINGENISNRSDAATYTNAYITRDPGSSEKINYSLDDLGFKDMKGKWTHVNNFNNQNANLNPEKSRDNLQREIKFIKSSGTEDFHCHPSWNTDTETQYINNWVLVHLTWIETVKDTDSPSYGKAIPREGYYLAFDFEAGKDKTKVKPDGYYSNWIVKITPAYFNPSTENAKRVMVEDLGGSFDFDFNDVVFDVAYENYNGGHEAIICVQAAGGTMPVIIGQPTSDTRYEVHNLLGETGMKPVNVGTGNDREVAIYRVDMTDTDLSKINIHVKNTINGTGNWQSYSGQAQTWLNLDNSEDNQYGTPQSTVDKNASVKLKAPRAFAIPLQAEIEIEYEGGDKKTVLTDSKWMNEKECLHDTYYEFDEWVKSEESSAGDGMDGTRGWWEQAHNYDKLYTKTIDVKGKTAGDSPAPAAWIPLHPQTDNKCFADYYLNIVGYDGEDAIWKELVKTSTQQITFTVVMESATEQDIEAILIPADVTETTDGGVTTTHMSYKGNEFASYLSSDTNDAAKAKVTGVFTKWQKAVESENRYKTDTNVHTYTCRFSFTKDQYMRVFNKDATTNADKSEVSSYFFLYIKSENGGVTIPAHPSVSTKSQWYIHY